MGEKFVEFVEKNILNLQPEDIKKFIDFLVSKELQEKLFWIKILFITISLIFLFAIFYYLKNSSYFTERYIEPWQDALNYKDFGISKRKKQWEKIKKRLKSENKYEWKIIFIDAHKFFEKALSESGYSQGSYYEKIKALEIEENIQTEKLIEFKKIFDDIIHDPDYELKKETLLEMIEVLEKTMVNLGLI